MDVLKVDLQSPGAADQFAQSLHNTGFAVIKNHPISVDLINQVYDDWAQFFASAIKNNYLYTEEDQDGFFPMDVSEVAKGFELKDIKEFYHYFPWGRHPENIGPATGQLFDQMQGLAAQLLTWIEEATPEHIRVKFSMPLDEMIEDCSRTLLRILHYPPLKGDEPEGSVRAAAHGDINLITLLPAATDTGLQVKDKQGNWHDVPCDYGTIAVNIGDMLEKASDHYYPSTIHQVINPMGDAAKRSRLSLPLFLHARNEVRLSDDYTAGQFLEERLRELGHITS